MVAKRTTAAYDQTQDNSSLESAISWDRDSFRNALLKENLGNVEIVDIISRDIEKEFANHNETPLTYPVMQKLIEGKLMRYGIKHIPPLVFPVTTPIKSEKLTLSPNAMTVLERRYLEKDDRGKPIEEPRDMFLRVAKNIAEAEGKYDKKANVPEKARTFYRLMTEMEFLPNSPTLMNAGRELQQLSACFVLPVEDSMEGIFDSLKHAALIHKSGGGTGFAFSKIRSKNSTVGSTGGVASGPISFMRIFNTATEQVKQGGTRRGANMGILRVDHPDIEEFIYAKEKDGCLNNFNLSVGITEAFMQAVKEDRDYNLVDPYTREVTGTLSARKIFDDIVDLAWKRGDPGIIFLDRLNRDNPTPKLGEIESTNPCVTADTFVFTSEGPRQVMELIGLPSDLVINGRIYPTTEKGFFATGEKDVFRLMTKEGVSLRLTGDHPVLKETSLTRWNSEVEWVPASELAPGDRIVLHNHRDYVGWPGPYTQGEGYLLGLLAGDETLKKEKAVISAWAQVAAANDGAEGIRCGVQGIMDAALAYARPMPHRNDFRGWEKNEGQGEYRLNLGHIKDLASDLRMKPGNTHITPQMEKASSDFVRGLLGGIFDVHGSIQGTYEEGVTVTLVQSRIHDLEAIQRMLLRCGIVSVIDTNQSELVIRRDNAGRFARLIGFRDTEKKRKLQSLLNTYKLNHNRERFAATFTGLVPDGKETVFDVQVPGVNAFDANGLVVHNCGEQPLLPYEACNLGSINLAKMVKVSDGYPEMDYDRLRRVVHTSVNFLDDVIDMSRFPIRKITDMVKGNRKIGLGVMGWADLLISLRIPYNSEAAIQLAEEVMSFVQQEGRNASAELGKTRGVFQNFKRSVYDKKGMPKVRNATTTTIAPTGTLSIIANCSSGIEPLFALSYYRNVMDNDKLIEINETFKKEAMRRGFYSDELMEKIASKGSIQELTEIPQDVRETFVTAHDVTPEWHIRMQAAFQKYTDNAVSKTVNFPHHATVQDVEEVYMRAFESGCKGVTIYRDGSKDQQVLNINNGEKKKENGNGSKAQASPAQPEPMAVPALEHTANRLSRPDILEGVTVKMKLLHGTLYITVNELDGKPVEVFATIGKSGQSTMAKTEAIGRLVSLSLRHGVPVENIVEQLKGIGGEFPIFQKDGLVRSIPDAIARILERRYMKTNGKNGKNAVRAEMDPLVTMNNICPDCSASGTLERSEGCVKCISCGYSKCS